MMTKILCYNENMKKSKWKYYNNDSALDFMNGANYI